jgi:hypothetical protein
MLASFTVTFLLDVAVNFGSSDSSIEGCHLLATTSAAAPPAATAAAPATATTSAATPALTAAAALGFTEALALRFAALPVLGFALHVLHFGGRTSAGTVVAAATTRAACFLATSIVTALARSISASVCGAGPLLRVFCPAPIGRRRRLVYRVPASVVVLLPTITGVLVNIAVVSGIHIAAGGFAGRSVSPGRARSGGLSSL